MTERKQRRIDDAQRYLTRKDNEQKAAELRKWLATHVIVEGLSPSLNKKVKEKLLETVEKQSKKVR